MMDAPERLWYEHDSDARFVWLDGGAGVEYVRADLYAASQNAMWERDEQWKRKVAALEQENEDLRKAQGAPERTLSEQIRAHGTGMPITPNDVTLIQMADEVAALEQERDELQKLLFVDRDEWRRFRVHGDTVLALESTAAQLARLREAVREMFRQMEEWGRDEVDFTALHALAGEG